jgi:hypothetical protein
MAGWTKFFVKQYGKKYLPLHHAGAYQDPKTIATIVGAFLHRKYVDRRHRLIVDVDLCSTISETTGAQIVTGLLGPQCYGDLYIPAEAITAITVSARTNEKGKLRDPWTCYDEIEAVVKSVRPDAIRVWQDSYKGGTNGSNHGQPMHVAAFLVGRLKGK